MEYMDDLGKIAVAWIATYGMKLIVALVVLVIGNWIAHRISNGLKSLLKRKNMDPLLVSFVGGVIYYSLVTATIIAAAGQLGINTTSFLAVAGSVGLAIGLAVKDNLASFASGVMLMITRHFTVGDYVTVAGGVSGTVMDITLPNTILSTPDNQKIVVPNSKITGNVITNVTANPNRRLDMVVGIGYNEDMAQAKEVINDVLKADPRVLQDPASTVAVAELADSSVNLVVRPWVAGKNYWATRFDLIENIKKALDANNINIPYPQRDLHVISQTKECV